METRQIHVRDLSTVTGIQQFEHEVQSIYFLGLEDFVGTIYLSIESDDYSNEAIPLTSNTFIVGQPMTIYNTTYTCQIYGVLNDGEKIQLSKRFRLIVDKSNTIQGESSEYPIDPNFTNGIIEFMNEQKEQAQSEIEATGEAVKASIPSDYTELESRVDEAEQELGIEPSYTIPPKFLEANYANASGTRKFKYENGVLDIMLKQNTVGDVGNNELPYSVFYSGAVIDGLCYQIQDKAYITLDYINSYAEASDLALLMRYYKSDLSSSFKAVRLPIPSGTGSIVFDLVESARNANFNVADYPKVVIRALSYYAHTAEEAESAEFFIKGFSNETLTLSERMAINESEISELNSKVDAFSHYESSSVIGNPFRFKPYYGHLFINTVGDTAENTYVPSQSLYDIEVCKRLGFDVIEVNTHILTDGTSLATHGVSNKFGQEFTCAVGSAYTEADIQNTDIASVSMDWVRTNVRYKAKYAKTRTVPPTLEEFLIACRENNMIPLINYKSIDQIEIANGIMGKDNYIMYGMSNAGRALTNCYSANFSNLTTKEAILNAVDNLGLPCIIGVTHYDNFTLSEWKDIVEEVHAKGALMAFAYMTEPQAHELFKVGFDCGASQYALNSTNSGNLLNLSADAGFSEYTVSDGIESDAQVTLAQNGTISYAHGNAYPLIGMWLDITFVGSISVKLGRFISHDNSVFTSDKPMTIHLSTYALNSAPNFEIKAVTNDSAVQNIVFKASKL